MVAASLLLLTAVASSCAPPAERDRDLDRVPAAIAERVRQGAGTAVPLDEIAAFEWRRVYLFGPYTPLKTVRESLGVADLAAARALGQGIESRDDATLIVFQFDGEAPESLALPRAYGDFGPELVGRGYAPDEARFVVRQPPAGSWGTIGPVQ